MRQSPGSVLGVILLLIVSALHADAPYSWRLSSGKSDVYVNEAVPIAYTCEFKDQGYLHVIELDIAGENENYRLISRGVDEAVVDGRRRDTFRYLLFPKKAGDQELRFTVLMRKTTKASIENSVIGRDNVEDYAFIDTKVALPPLHLNVADHRETMTGRFELAVQLDKEAVNAYTPVHLDIKVKGEGNFDEMTDYALHIDRVKIFSEPGEKHYRLGSNGFEGTWEQKFSIVGSRDFVIEPITFSYFDIAQKRKVTLRSKRFEVKVNAAYQKEELLDETTDENGVEWWSWSYLNYLFIFLTGLLLGRYSLRYKRVKKVKEGFLAEIEACASVKQLLTKLVMRGEARFAPLIEKYEALGPNASLSSLKSELRTILKDD